MFLPSYERTVLIVDDELDILESVERLLRKEYRVLTAQTPNEARAIVGRETVHVVLSDQRMPTESGVQFLAGLRRTNPDIVRVLLTGYSNINHVIDAINQGHVYRYVTKPWDPSEFKILVAQCFERWESRKMQQMLVDQLHEHDRRQRRDLARLDHDRVAGHERRCKLAAQDSEREVPRADCGHYAERYPHAPHLDARGPIGQRCNLAYRVGEAEHLPIEDHSVDLVTVAQAAHWSSVAQLTTIHWSSPRAG